MWLQITFLLLMTSGSAFAIAKGRPAVPQLLANGATIGLLYAGGFFTVLGWAP